MKILAIVPAYNEEKNIINVIHDLKRIKGLEVLVINDCSRDKTYQAAMSTNKCMVADLPINLGIGGGVQTGFIYANKNNFDYALQFDGDGQHLAEEIPKLLKPLIAGEADVVIGSRFLLKSKGFRSTFMRRIGIYYFAFLNSILIRKKITDNTSGFRAYNRKAIKLLSKYYPTDYPEPEAVILLGKNKLRIKEISVLMQERLHGTSSIGGLKSAYYMLKVTISILFAAIRPPLPQEIFED
jgi:glycosyltransferase involved in cell wall biosynthesis